MGPLGYPRLGLASAHRCHRATRPRQWYQAAIGTIRVHPYRSASWKHLHQAEAPGSVPWDQGTEAMSQKLRAILGAAALWAVMALSLLASAGQKWN